jgi:hypothetical protein
MTMFRRSFSVISSIVANFIPALMKVSILQTDTTASFSIA